MSSRRDEDAEPGHERWLVSYADFITLMFAFFTILYATSEKDMEKTKEFQDSIKRYLIRAGSFGGTGEKLEQGEKYNRVIEPPIETFKAGNATDEKTVEQLELNLEGSFTTQERAQYIIDINLDALGIRLALKGHELYPEGGLQIKESATVFLNKLAEVIKPLGRRIAIEGHVLDKKYKGLDPVDAGALRASAIAKYYTSKKTFKANEMVVISQGAQQKLEGNLDPSGNERIEILLLNDASEL